MRNKFERKNNMRNNNHQVVFQLNENDYAHLIKQIEVSGLTKAAYFRKLIRGQKVKPKTPEGYNKLVREISKIGSDINQIAYQANAVGYTQDSKTALTLLKKGIELMREMR